MIQDITIPITAPRVPAFAESMMPERAQTFGEGLWELLTEATEVLNPSLAEAASVCLSLIAVVLLISIVVFGIYGSGYDAAAFVYAQF